MNVRAGVRAFVAFVHVGVHLRAMSSNSGALGGARAWACDVSTTLNPQHHAHGRSYVYQNITLARSRVVCVRVHVGKPCRVCVDVRVCV